MLGLRASPPRLLFSSGDRLNPDDLDFSITLTALVNGPTLGQILADTGPLPAGRYTMTYSLMFIPAGGQLDFTQFKLVQLREGPTIFSANPLDTSRVRVSFPTGTPGPGTNPPFPLSFDIDLYQSDSIVYFCNTGGLGANTIKTQLSLLRHGRGADVLRFYNAVGTI